MQVATAQITFRTGPDTEVRIAKGEHVPDVLAALVPAALQAHLRPADPTTASDADDESTDAADALTPAPRRKPR